MNKVFEVHFGYMCGGIVLLLHIIIGFYLLYILQIDLGKLEIPTGQKVVWYTPPPVNSEPTIPESTAYIPPTQQDNIPSASTTDISGPMTAYTAEPPLSSPVPTRTIAQRRASWSKTTAPQSVSAQLDAARIIQEISEDQAQQRSAQAVYTTKHEQIKARAAAQMLEITQERMRNKVIDALKIICHETSAEYHTPRPITSSILATLVISQEGEIISIELLRSTGTRSLDDHIIMLLQKIKKITTPPRKTFNGIYTMTFEFGVRCQAGNNHLEVIRADGKATTHIL